MVKIFTDMVNNASEHKYKYPISKIVDYIYQNVTSKITVSDLSHLTHLSPDYISRVFNQEVGMSITDYIQKKKVEASKSFLLFRDISITDVAAIFDFCNHGYYSRVFKKHTGYSPAESESFIMHRSSDSSPLITYIKLQILPCYGKIIAD